MQSPPEDAQMSAEIAFCQRKEILTTAFDGRRVFRLR
jgi:hypothetical protein